MTDQNVTVVLGGMAGSEGKGKFAGYLAIKDDFDVAISNFMPNAGHTWVSNDGEKVVMVQQLPQAVVNPRTLLLMSAGSAIEIGMLKNEIEKFGANRRFLIHPRAVIIDDHHLEAEKKNLNRISSTLKGCGYALADKTARVDGTRLAKDVPELSPYVIQELRFNDLLNEVANGNGSQILVECPQGFDLDVNHGIEYPYCTSRQTTSAQAIADAGLPPQSVKEVVACIRPYPIRVGDAFDSEGNKIGTSGSYLDSKELTWEEIAERGGTPFEEISELTTVTKKLRRVFEPNMHRLKQMCRVNGVTQLALNFANYLDYNMKGATQADLHRYLSGEFPKVSEFVSMVEDATGVPVTLIGTGARDNEILDLRHEKGFIGK
jgi:adenylosuccinate synthase